MTKATSCVTAFLLSAVSCAQQPSGASGNKSRPVIVGKKTVITVSKEGPRSDEIGKIAVDAALDEKKPNIVIIRVDLSAISNLKMLTGFKVPVRFYDAKGKLVWEETFSFTDYNQPVLAGGQKYARPFEIGKSLPARIAVKVQPASGSSYSGVVASIPDNGQTVRE